MCIRDRSDSYFVKNVQNNSFINKLYSPPNINVPLTTPSNINVSLTKSEKFDYLEWFIPRIKIGVTQKLWQVNINEIEGKAKFFGLESKDYIQHTEGFTPRLTSLRFAELSQQELPRANFSFIKLQGARFSSAKLQGARFTSSQLQGVYLTNADLQGAFLSSAQLQGAILTLANLQKAELVYAQLQGSNLSQATLQSADLSNASLLGAELKLAEFSGAKLYRSDLQGSDLSSAQLQGAYLEEANFNGADLNNSNWSGAVFGGTNFNALHNQGTKFYVISISNEVFKTSNEDWDQILKLSETIPLLGNGLRTKENFKNRILQSKASDTNEAKELTIDNYVVIPSQFTNYFCSIDNNSSKFNNIVISSNSFQNMYIRLEEDIKSKGQNNNYKPQLETKLKQIVTGIDKSLCSKTCNQIRNALGSKDCA